MQPLTFALILFATGTCRLRCLLLWSNWCHLLRQTSRGLHWIYQLPLILSIL